MQLNPNDPALMSAVNQRLTRELGDAITASLALDIVCDSLVAENTALKSHNEALVQRTTNDREVIEGLREELTKRQRKPA